LKWGVALGKLLRIPLAPDFTSTFSAPYRPR
jgi:hypothetical protein